MLHLIGWSTCFKTNSNGLAGRFLSSNIFNFQFNFQHDEYSNKHLRTSPFLKNIFPTQKSHAKLWKQKTLSPVPTESLSSDRSPSNQISDLHINSWFLTMGQVCTNPCDDLQWYPDRLVLFSRIYWSLKIWGDFPLLLSCWRRPFCLCARAHARECAHMVVTQQGLLQNIARQI